MAEETAAGLRDDAPRGDGEAFEQLVAGYQRELLAHCYRMTGSMQDAEDALQESMLGAWRGLDNFAGRSSIRTWLYRVSTNACLRLISRRPRRLLSTDHGPPRDDPRELGDIVTEPIWMEPWPETELVSSGEDPAVIAERRESLELAFVAAVQHLPGRQRAVLLLREALDFSAAEVAEILETSPAAVNSTLQRARAAVAARMPGTTQRVQLASLGEAGQWSLVSALVDAWERADVAAILALLTEDVRFTMPPLPAWFGGKKAVGRFIAERMLATPWRLAATRANGQLALACYIGDRGDGSYRLAAINVVSVRGGRISELAGFLDPGVHRRFHLPPEWPTDPPAVTVR